MSQRRGPVADTPDRQPHTIAPSGALSFSHLYASVRLWASWGITPAALVGPGAAEYVNAVLHGVFTLDEALDLVVARETIAVLLARPKSERWDPRQLDDHLDAFEAAVAAIGPRRPDTPYLSTVTGGPVDAARVATARFWRDEVTCPANLRGALTAASALSGGTVLAFGTGGLLDGLVGEVLPDRRVLVSLDQSVPLLRVLGELWAEGQTVDWSAVTPAEHGRVHLPGYAFDSAKRGAFAPVPHTRAPGATAPSQRAVQEESQPGEQSDHERITALLVTSLDADGVRDLDKSFFELGGDSLSAVHLVDRLRTELGVEVPLTFLFESTSLQDLVDKVAGLVEAGTDRELDALLSEFEAD